MVVERSRSPISASAVLARGLGRERRRADPEDRRRAHGRAIDRGELDLHVGRRRLAVEEQLRLLRRVHGRERERRPQRRVRADEAHVDAEALGSAPRTYSPNGSSPTAVTTRRATAEPRRGDGDVRRAAADRLRERLDAGEADTLLAGVEIDADAPDGDEIEGHGPGSYGAKA